MTEQVNHPNHYGGKDNEYEAIKVIEAWDLDFHLGNVINHISQSSNKENNEQLEHLKKSLWFLERKIQVLENSSNLKQLKDLRETTFIIPVCIE